MFDVGFFELLLIAVVGLIVIGPKRLPETIRFVGLWAGRIRRRLSAAKKEFEQEFGIDDVRRQLHNETVLKELGDSSDDRSPESSSPEGASSSEPPDSSSTPLLPADDNEEKGTSKASPGPSDGNHSA